MAKKAESNSVKHLAKTKVKRKGVHAKTKTSSVKTSKLYKKKSRGQGK